MDNLLTPLADYSRQLLQVGTPPLNLYTAAGARPSQDIVQLSLLARIAEALESRPQLATAVLPVQPRYADEFREVVAELFTDRGYELRIEAWHLRDVDTLHVTLAYQRVESIFFLGRYWENITAELVRERSQNNG